MSPGYREQLEQSIAEERQELENLWKYLRSALSEVKRYKNRHFDIEKGHEVYTCDQAVVLQRLNEYQAEFHPKIKLQQLRVWKLQSSLQRLISEV